MAALGLMAFTAVAAQAEEPVALSDGGKAGLFLVNKEGALAKAGVTFSAEQQGTGTLLVPGRVDILCKKGSATGEFINDTEALGSAEFSECTAWQPVGLGLPHVTPAKCTVKEPIKVIKALALPKTHGGEPFILLEEDPTPAEKAEGKSPGFTTIFLEGPECILTKENKVTGGVHVLIDNNDTTAPLLLFSEVIAKLFQPTTTTGTHLKFGAFDSFIDADATAKLTDANHTGVGKEFPLGVC